MPTNQGKSAAEICPFFRGRGKTFVICESLVEEASTRISFPSYAEAEAYAWKRCRTYDWWRCPHAAALDDLYDDQGRR